MRLLCSSLLVCSPVQVWRVPWMYIKLECRIRDVHSLAIGLLALNLRINNSYKYLRSNRFRHVLDTAATSSVHAALRKELSELPAALYDISRLLLFRN